MCIIHISTAHRAPKYIVVCRVVPKKLKLHLNSEGNKGEIFKYNDEWWILIALLLQTQKIFFLELHFFFVF